MNYKPEGYHSLTPYLVCDGAAKAIEFYKSAFNAVEVMRMPGPDGKLAHAEIKIGDSHLMLADESSAINAYAPGHYGGSPAGLLLYVEDCDSTVATAVANGAKVTRPVQDQFYGDRSGGITDPFGHNWYIHTHIKDVSMEEMQELMPKS